MTHAERLNALNNTKAAKHPPAQNPPSATLYCNNLNDKLLKGDLRRELYMLFSNHSTVIDIITLKTRKMRGQAHIVFQNAEKAGMAMKALQGYDFHGRKINIAYAKGRSNVFNKLLGTYVLEQPAQQQQSAGTTQTSLQQSIFNNPNASLPPPPTTNGAAPDAEDAKRKRADEEAAEQAKRQRVEAAPAVEEEEQEDDEMDMEESDEE
ncbi:RNA binding domain protein [Phyllosticta capitalensis]